jgi:hypothetical protein
MDGRSKIVELKSQQLKDKRKSSKKPRGPGRSDRDKEGETLMRAAKQFGFEKCAFLGTGHEISLATLPDDLDDDEDPLHLANNAQVQLPLKSLAAAYRAYLPSVFRERADDEEIASKVM